MANPDITVYHLGLSQSERITWLLEELGIPYKLDVTERDPVTKLAPDSYQNASPTGSAPFIHDGNGDVTLAESTAIIDYIIYKYAGGRLAVKPDAPNFPDYCFWYHWANGSFQSAIMGYFRLTRAKADESNPIVGFAKMGVNYSLESIDKRLAKVPYLAGDELTAADIVIFFSLTTMRLFAPQDLSSYPNILAYLKRVAERPAYQTAIKKGDPNLKPVLEAVPEWSIFKL